MQIFKCMIFICVYFNLHSLAADNLVVPKGDNQIKLSFAPVVSKVSPAVVNIFTSRKKQTVTNSPFFDDPFFKRFFALFR